VFTVEVAGDELGSALRGAQVGAGVADQLVLGVRAAAAERVGLDVLVEQLSGVELGAIAGQELQLDLLGMRPTQAFTFFERWTGWPSRIRMIFCPLLWRMSRERKSMNTAATNFSLKTRNCRCPLLEIAEITFAPNRWPVPSTTGVLPTGLHERPAVWSERKPISSTHRISARSR
jgi:hypothetical protein